MGKSSAVRVEQLERVDEYVVSVWRRMMLLVWRDRANPNGIERSRVLFEEWVKDHPRGAVFLIVVPGQRTRAPDEATVEAMKRAASTSHPRCKGMATFLEAEGFIAASVRLLMMRLHATAGRGGEAEVFGSPAQAALWAAKLLGDEEITAVSLVEAIRLSREH